MEKRLTELEKNYESLEKMVNLIDDYSKHITNQTLGILSIVVALATFILTTAAYFMIKNIVNNKINQELDKRLFTIMEKNPPVFSASGITNPGLDKIIYLSPEINGIDQLEPEEILMIRVTPEKLILNGIVAFNPEVRKNEDGIVEIEIPEYHENNGRIHWKVVWSRKRYTI